MSASILNEALPVLIRESLDDSGKHVCVNHSPDIIVLKNKLRNPTMELREYYDKDISQDSDDSGQMYIYVRLKNVSGKKLTKIYVRLYRNHLGLYNHPNDWSSAEMKTDTGATVYIESLEPEEICVTPAFLYSRTEQTGNANCFVAVATHEPDPSYSDINTYDKYVQWINKPNIAARNVCVRRRRTHHDEQKFPVHGLKKPSASLMGFFIKVVKCSSETKYGIFQPDLYICEEKVCISDQASGNYIFCVATVPPEFEGTLLVWNDSLEESHMKLDVTLWDLILSPNGETLRRYYIDLMAHLDDVPVMSAIAKAADLSDNAPVTVQGTLLGGCRLEYQGQKNSRAQKEDPAS